MKKIFRLTALILACLTGSFMFNSCSDDDGDGKSGPSSSSSANIAENIEGTWTIEKMKMTVLGQTIEMSKEELSAASGYDRFYDDVLTFSNGKVNGLDYTLEDNRMLLPWYESVEWWADVTVTSSKLTLYYNITTEGVKMQLWTIYSRSRGSADACGAAKAGIADALTGL